MMTPEERAARVWESHIGGLSFRADVERGIADAIRAAILEEREACAAECGLESSSQSAASWEERACAARLRRSPEP